MAHYEQQGKTDKVIEHMNNFKLLLDHQLGNQLIDENAYDTLTENTNSLIQKWDDVTIVQNGGAKAVVIAPSDSVSTNAPNWTRWSNFSGTIERTDTDAYSGNSSLLIEGMEVGGIWQNTEVELGPVLAQIQYYTDEGSTNIGEFSIKMNLRDENFNNLTSLKPDFAYIWKSDII